MSENASLIAICTSTIVLWSNCLTAAGSSRRHSLTAPAPSNGRSAIDPWRTVLCV